MRPKQAAFISVALLFLSWASPGQTAFSEDKAALSGVVHDISRAVVAGADVTLSRVDGSQQRSSKSGADGTFAFTGLPADTYVVNVRAPGLQIFTSGRLVLVPHQTYYMPNIVMGIAIANTEVTVRPTEQGATEQVRAEERQRIFGLIPNYFTSYIFDPVPLTARQKFSLTSHDAFDPVSLVGVGIAAGIQQSSNSFAGYGQGAAGYGKRYGAALGNSLSDDFLSHAVFPALLHQDPRYFYQGSGSKRSRLLHAISFAVLTRSDNGRTTLNYSYLLGDLGSGALSNLYYPHADRGTGLVFTNAAIGIGGRAAGSIFREFFSKRVTRNLPANAKP